MPRGMTRKMNLFVHYYLMHGENTFMNATQSAIAAGYKQKTAYSTGQSNLKHPEIAALINAKTEQIRKKSDINYEKVVNECAKLAFNNPKQAFNQDGSLKPITEWPDRLLHCVSSFEVEEIMANGNTIGHLKKVKFWSKTESLNLLSKLVGIIKDVQQIQNQNNWQINLNILENNQETDKSLSDISELENVDIKEIGLTDPGNGNGGNGNGKHNKH